MNIRKRIGEVVPFQEEKILNAMKKAFSGQAQEIDDRALDEMLSVVLKRLPENGGLTVERVQDEVERVLMECGHYEVAKAYPAQWDYILPYSAVALRRRGTRYHPADNLRWGRVPGWSNHCRRHNPWW